METFNIFQVAGIWKSEEIHTRVIAELLNPNSRFHDMGTVFLQKFLVALGLDEDLSKAKIEDIEVKPEVSTDNGRSVDMVISTPHYYLPFEVKIEAKDQNSQVYDYYQYACSEARKVNKKTPHIYYLTADGHAPTERSRKSSANSSAPYDELADGAYLQLSFQELILPWLNDCIKNTDQPISADVLEIMKQLRDNIQGHPGEGEGEYQPAHQGFSEWWPKDILDQIYSELFRRYNLPRTEWTECNGCYITCRIHKEGGLEFALRIKKEKEDSLRLHLICGHTQGDGNPDYGAAGSYIQDHPQEFQDLLSKTFSKRENINDSTAKSTWDRLKSTDHKSQDGIGLEACLEKIEEIFSWLDHDIKEKLRRS